MVECQLTCRQHLPTKLAGIPVAQQDILPREGAGLIGNVPEFPQPDNRRNADSHAGRMDEAAVLLLRRCRAFEYQHNGTTDGGYINGLVGRVENEHRNLQQSLVSLLHIYFQRLVTSYYRYLRQQSSTAQSDVK